MKKRLLVLAYGMFLLLLAEGSARVYLRFEYGRPVAGRANILYTYYPEVEVVAQSDIGHRNGELDVLLLGASVLAMHSNRIENLLQEALDRRSSVPVSIYNVSVPAHTSMDSLYKYELLDDKAFDLVVVYHNINELRANNCPPPMFQEDYSHYSWYEQIGLAVRHPELSISAFPFAAHKIWMDLARSASGRQYVQEGAPRPEWLLYGESVKTAKTLRRNLENILVIARRREARVVLMSFAYYVPEEYSFAAFKEKTLDYELHSIPIELWGGVPQVISGLDKHNQVIEDVALSNPDVIYIDQEEFIRKEGKNFDDVCHLSFDACQEFIDHLVAGLGDFLQRSEGF